MFNWLQRIIKQNSAEFSENDSEIRNQIGIAKKKSGQIVLHESFNRCFHAACNHGNAEPSVVQSAYSKMLRQYNKVSMGFEGVEMYGVPLSKMKGSDIPPEPPQFLKEFSERILAVYKGCVDDLEEAGYVDQEKMKELRARVELRSSQVQPAMKLVDLLGVWDSMLDFEKLRKNSLKSPSDQGRSILAFWKAVNNLNDYTVEVFPDEGARGLEGSQPGGTDFD